VLRPIYLWRSLPAELADALLSAADLAPIRALLDQGCDLDGDFLPIVARELPELSRPLKNWGAPWLVRDILAAPACTVSDAVEAPPPDRDGTSDNYRRGVVEPPSVEDPPPPRRAPPAIDWDEFVGGYRAGLIA
jgi:hypothetical protein